MTPHTPPERDVRDALHVEIQGDGPAVVLAHGFAGSARNFRPQARALRDAFRVALYDARGHARSFAPTDPAAYTLPAFVADFARVAERTGAARVAAGGLSFGALTALEFALAHPGRVSALVLASFPAGAGGGGTTDRARAFADAIDAEGLEAAGARFVWGPDSGLDAAAARWVRQGFLEHPPHALAAILRGVLADLPAAAERAPALAALSIPVLLIAGAADAPSVAAHERLAAHLPQATAVVVPDAGHVVNLAQPAAFGAALRAFLMASV